MSENYEDDVSIEDEEGLLRRVPNQPNMVKFDENINAYRPSSACFCDRQTNDLEVSVTLEQPLLDDGETHEFAIKDYPEFGVAQFLTAVARYQVTPNQIIRRDPTDDDPYHGLVVGYKTRVTRRQLAKKSTMVIKPQLSKS